MNTNQIFYTELLKLRELFHKYGRFDDSNTKLDEISKYIAIYVYQLKYNVFSEDNLKLMVEKYEKGNRINLVEKLKNLFLIIAESQEFLDANKLSIFGNNPTLNIDNNDNDFAYHLIKLVVNSIESNIDKSNGIYNYDLLNETFGHFVRDNFRNHIEDAQYMTPIEVVETMCNMVLDDLEKEGLKNSKNEYIVCDPCCGVGTFLSTFYKKNKNSNIINTPKLRLIGQDKVDRMVRLAKINMLLFKNSNHIIMNGNSLSGKSTLDNYINMVDLILTNPPFGAKFKSTELTDNLRVKYPLLNDVILNNGFNFNSEILFIDRCISLLKPNGKLIAILPDSVISSAGLNLTLRHRLINSKYIKIKAIIELPAVTFAQAGTRTKTSILYLEKIKSTQKKVSVFIAQAENVGFEVNTKKGATIKKENGQNDLIKIFEIYKNNNTSNISNLTQNALYEKPSCMKIKYELLLNNSWTASHYNAKKYNIINQLIKNKKKTELVKLKEIVTFSTNYRKREYIEGDYKCISVLHILNDDYLNYEEFLKYKPKYAGITCKPGDLLFSKINPRIMRLLIVPELFFNLTCSSEFEIINSKIEINNFGIKLLLMLPSVQTQINYLTSGTSSSHNRIKTKDLGEVLIPLPKRDTKLYEKLIQKIKEYEFRNKKTDKLRQELNLIKKEIYNLFSM